MIDKPDMTDLLRSLAVQVDALASSLVFRSDDEVEVVLDCVRRELTSSLRGTVAATGARALADQLADAIERRSQEMIRPNAHRHWLH